MLQFAVASAGGAAKEHGDRDPRLPRPSRLRHLPYSGDGGRAQEQPAAGGGAPFRRLTRRRRCGASSASGATRKATGWPNSNAATASTSGTGRPAPTGPGRSPRAAAAPVSAPCCPAASAFLRHRIDLGRRPRRNVDRPWKLFCRLRPPRTAPRARSPARSAAAGRASACSPSPRRTRRRAAVAPYDDASACSAPRIPEIRDEASRPPDRRAPAHAAWRRSAGRRGRFRSGPRRRLPSHRRRRRRGPACSRRRPR